MAHTSKGSPVFMVACVNLHNAKMLDAPHSRCPLSQKRKELHPLDISQMAQTAEDKYAQACGADLVSLAADRAATADKKDTAVQTVMPRAACRSQQRATLQHRVSIQLGILSRETGLLLLT